MGPKQSEEDLSGGEDLAMKLKQSGEDLSGGGI